MQIMGFKMQVFRGGPLRKHTKLQFVQIGESLLASQGLLPTGPKLSLQGTALNPTDLKAKSPIWVGTAASKQGVQKLNSALSETMRQCK